MIFWRVRQAVAGLPGQAGGGAAGGRAVGREGVKAQAARRDRIVGPRRQAARGLSKMRIMRGRRAGAALPGGKA